MKIKSKYLRYLIFPVFIIAPDINALPETKTGLQDMVVHINITAQHYDHYSPWDKGPVKQIQAAGAVLEGNIIVTASQHLADHQLVEVQKHGEMKKYPARIMVKDYRTGIAFITVDDKKFFADLNPATLAEPERVVGEEAVTVRWDDTGSFREYSARGYSTSMEKQSEDVFDSPCLNLVHNMTTAMDNGGYGEPVFLKGKLAGISTGFNEKTSTIRVCPAEIIKKMIREMSGGRYAGAPFFHIRFIPLESDVNLRDYLKLKPGTRGIYVSGISAYSSGCDTVKPGDVIVSIDGTEIDDRGLYKSDAYGALDFRGLIFLRHSTGDSVAMKVMRNGAPEDITFNLRPYRGTDFTVTPEMFDSQPSYFIFGGLIFQELSRGYLNTAAGDTGTRENARFQNHVLDSLMMKSPGKKRLIILNRVLPSQVNSGCEDKRDLILSSLNGEIPADLMDLRRLIKETKTKYVKFDFIGGEAIVLEKEEAGKSTPSILKRYNIEAPYFP